MTRTTLRSVRSASERARYSVKFNFFSLHPRCRSTRYPRRVRIARESRVNISTDDTISIVFIRIVEILAVLSDYCSRLTSNRSRDSVRRRRPILRNLVVPRVGLSGPGETLASLCIVSIAMEERHWNGILCSKYLRDRDQFTLQFTSVCTHAWVFPDPKLLYHRSNVPLVQFSFEIEKDTVTEFDSKYLRERGQFTGQFGPTLSTRGSSNRCCYRRTRSTIFFPVSNGETGDGWNETQGDQHPRSIERSASRARWPRRCLSPLFVPLVRLTLVTRTQIGFARGST